MAKRKVDNQTAEIIASFVAEGFERLDDAEAQLGQLDKSCNDDCLNSVFRLFHSVKGSAGFLGFEAIKLLTHDAETLLEVFIKGREALSPDALDVIYQTIDLLRKMIQAVERDNNDDELLDAGRAQAGILRSCVAAIAQAKTAPAAVLSPTPANVIVLSELVSRDMVERFLVECADLVDEVERKALVLVTTMDSTALVNDLFRAVHTIKGNSGFFDFASLEGLCMSLESHLDRARRGEVPINESLANGLIAGVDAIRSCIGTVEIRAETELGQDGAEPPAAPSHGQAKAAMSANAALGGQGDFFKPLGEILVGIGAASEDAVRKALEMQERPIGEILVAEGAASPADVEAALVIQKAALSPERRAAEEVQRKEIRVDTAKLDKLFELVGELITAESMVYNSPDLAGLKLDNFNKAYLSLNKISREIQETTMMIRMIPLEALFHKMSRLVHDLSRKTGKPAEFIVTGAETEMDKNVIEQVSDPLVHILRNALDHGIEDGPRRAAAGKSATASIRLDARYEGSEIWISVRDDGAGLDRERILRKAQDRGLLSVDPETLSDEEVWKIIFEPGFSTSEKVTEVSGRGVGMDVVRKNLERIRGRVDIRTESGQFTEFVLKIPLTMAIIDGITLRAGGNFYSIPLGDILEFFKVAPAQLTETDRGEMTVNVRGSLLPLMALGEIFAIPGAVRDPLAGIVIIIRNAERRACLLIDEVVGNQQIVVKSLSEYLGKVEGISGCSILGDGTVSFIIDTGRLMSLRLE